MPPKDKYTDPKLRDEVKEEIKESDKGGAPGQWSARKAQFMASEYKKRGGGYTTDKKNGQDESQKNLEKWGEEDWQTKDGSGEAKQKDGSRKRYLPKKAWDEMDDEEKEKTDAKKQAGSKKGKQFVGNTPKAKAARKNAGKDTQEEDEAEEDQDEDEDDDDGEDDEDDEDDAPEEDEDEEDKVDDDDNADDDDAEDEEKENKKAGQKRSRATSKEDSAPSKKQKDSDGKAQQSNGDSKKTMGSKHDSAEAPAPQGSSDRLPKEGQKVTWKAMPGWVYGKVLEIVTSNKTMQGKSIKASKEDPRIALEADSGKFCVHKPDACYFETDKS